MAVDLRNPQGKYGANFQALAGLVNTITAMQVKNRERRVQKNIIEDLSQGKTIEEAMSNMDFQQPQQSGNPVYTMLRSVVGGFDPSRESPTTTPFEQQLRGALITQKLREGDPSLVMRRQELSERRNRARTGRRQATLSDFTSLVEMYTMEGLTLEESRKNALKDIEDWNRGNKSDDFFQGMGLKSGTFESGTNLKDDTGEPDIGDEYINDAGQRIKWTGETWLKVK